uniref:Protein kinase domain-containing protein n=1 Tax=Strigamia maritima TaxID=126957 RepID=T1JHS6_STRMM
LVAICSSHLIIPDTGLFKGLDINFDSLVEQKLPEFDKISIISTRSRKQLPEKHTTKKAKRQSRHDAFLRKIDVIKQTLKEEKGGKFQLWATMHLLADALPSLELLKKESKKKKSERKKENNNKKYTLEKTSKHRENENEGKRSDKTHRVISKVIKNPSFKSNPFETILDMFKKLKYLHTQSFQLVLSVISYERYASTMASSVPKHLIKASTIVFKSPVKTSPHKTIRKKFFPPNYHEKSFSTAKFPTEVKLGAPNFLVATGVKGTQAFEDTASKPFEKENKKPQINRCLVFNEESPCYSNENDAEIDDVESIEMDTPTRQQVSSNGLESLTKTPPVLGQGGFGVVIKAVHKGHKVAVKVINTNRRRKISIDHCLAGEMNAMALKHPNIVETLGVFGLNEKNLLILMEFAGPKSLQYLLDDINEMIDWERRFATEILDALQYCHSSNMAHLDVKPANVIISSNDSCKLCDFGCSKILDAKIEHCDSTFPLDGTIAYKAPELLRGFPPTLKADIYSAGITLWQLLTRKIPFADTAPHAIVYKVVAFEARPIVPDIQMTDYLPNVYVKLFV